MISRIALASALLAAALAVTTVQAQQVYRWVDAQGDVHYSQTPPPGAGTHVKQVNVSPVPVNATAAREQQALVNSVAAADSARQKAADEAAQAAAKKARQAEACTAARQQLQEYMDTHRVITNANTDHPSYYSGEDLVKFRAQAQAQVNKVCSGS